MKINWKVRLNNPLWVAQLLCSIILPILAYMGINWEDVTSWSILLDLLKQAANNPVVVVAIIISVFNTITDPTTNGISDSIRALGYDKPHKD